MRGNHHIHFANRLAHRDELVTDLRVEVGDFRIPGQHSHDPQKLANARRSLWFAGKRFRP